MSKPLEVNTAQLPEDSLPSPATSPSSNKKDDSPFEIKGKQNESSRQFTPEPESEDEEESHPFRKCSSTSRRCNYCGATSTPMWRHGPGEYTNLCNSCGVKWRRGKILASGNHRHHLCKPPTPPKKKSVKNLNVSNKQSKRKAEESLEAPKEKIKQVKVNEVKTPEIVPEVQEIIVPTTIPDYPANAPVFKTPVQHPEVEKTIGIHPQAIKPNNSGLVKKLTNEFADLLEKLPAARTAEFTSILAKCFEPKVAEAYRIGVEVEMSVLDITESTWSSLRNIVQC